MATFNWTFVIAAILGGLIPAVIWLLFWLNEDQKRPEPRGNILRAFWAGGLAVLIAFFLERPFLEIIGPLTGTQIEWDGTISTLWLILSSAKLILVWSLIEEVVKYLAAQTSVLGDGEFDEPVDAMIYLITVALGFAAVENSLFLFDLLLKGESNIYFLLTGQLRFLGATIVHTVSSGLVGASIALAFCAPFWKKILAISGGLATATLLHAAFNFFIINNNGAATAHVLLFLWLATIFIIFLFERVKSITCAILPAK